MQKKLIVNIGQAGLLILLLLLNGCAAKNVANNSLGGDFDEEELFYAEENISDPLEPINRTIFSFNDGLYTHFFFPIADAYGLVMPAKAKNGITNFFHNLAMPIHLVGDILQLKGEKALIDFWAPVINLSGLWFVDVYNLDDDFDNEDVSQGFASWGISAGPYIVWPIIGPSNLRNTVGTIGNIFLSPQTYLGAPGNALANAGEATNQCSKRNSYREITTAAIDPYNAVKDAYASNFQKRLSK